ncbi:MAG: type III-A CRISPR-associated RAMP protein Csm4 [Fusobacteriaceae bacterium]|jgi:CRISPR-associated protein Csm4|nr:type III-A CRISPR-associated RAMP protein Csm4 [Fusobacteriaceae bacterium]
MDYIRYKLAFETGLHVGADSLEDAAFSICSDTIFSALCIEALKSGGVEELDRFVGYCRKDEIKISDGFPYIGKGFYIPKPICKVDKKEDGDSARKKLFKKLAYIREENIQRYLDGELDPEQELAAFKELGAYALTAKVALDTAENNNLYNVGSYHFHKDNGIFIIVGVKDEEKSEYMFNLLENLSYSGIGGKRSAGYGRFSLKGGVKETASIAEAGQTGHKKYVLLSTAMAKEEELLQALGNAQYQLIKRGGFVFSETYSEQPLKKNDFYSFQSGSVFERPFEGDIFDVSDNGTHPVYRYAKPMFLGVN